MDDEVVVVRAGAPFTGLVVDSSGDPVADATIAFLEAPVAMPDTAQLTGSDGRFTLSLPAAGRYRLGVYGGQGSALVDLHVEVGGGGGAGRGGTAHRGVAARIVLRPA